MTNERLTKCPKCEGALFYSPDGRAQECERCGFRNELEIHENDSIIELEKALRFMRVGIHSIDSQMGDHTQRRVHRDMLTQGISAVKQNKMDEAYFHLSKVLKASNSHEEERLTAWFWLSAVAKTDEEKRLCLENVLVLNPGHPGARRGMAMLEGRLKEEEIINPEQLNQVDNLDEEALKATAEKMRCPRCDGRMGYNPEMKALQCDFCHYRISPGGKDASDPDIEDALNNEQDFIVALATAKGHRQPIQMRSMACSSCGIEFILAPETLSLACPYCDSVYVVEAAETREIIPPQGVVPFNVSHEEATKALRQWFKKHDIERPRVSPIEAFYVPVWTFDISGPITWSCMVRQGDQWVHRSGEHFTLHDDVLIPASTHLPHALLDHFDDFDLTALVPYNNRYLADIPAERYQIPVSDASLKARGIVMQELRKRPERFAQVLEYRDFKLSARGGLAVQSYKLILLPLWIVHYKVEDEVFDVTINGQNKTIHGARPKGVVGKLFSWLLG